MRTKVPPGGQVGTRPPEQTAGKPEVFARKPEVLGCMTLLQLNDNLRKISRADIRKKRKVFIVLNIFMIYFCDSFLEISATPRH